MEKMKKITAKAERVHRELMTRTNPRGQGKKGARHERRLARKQAEASKTKIF